MAPWHEGTPGGLIFRRAGMFFAENAGSVGVEMLLTCPAETCRWLGLERIEMPEFSCLFLTAEDRAEQQPDVVAYVPRLRRRSAGFADRHLVRPLRTGPGGGGGDCSTTDRPGDRAAILAPQGHGLYRRVLPGRCTPGSSPSAARSGTGRPDERVVGALRDSGLPTVPLTTSAAVADVVPYAASQSGGPAPEVIEVDTIDPPTGARRR